jgi:hypothetical protein
MSVDPDVAETGQPYAAFGDDPLNATDPLGLYLSGGDGGEIIAPRRRRRPLAMEAILESVGYPRPAPTTK